LRDDFSGLDYAEQRYYSSALGRFITPDPYQGSIRIHNPETWNRYAYVVNNPINFNDPHGLDKLPGGGPFSSLDLTIGYNNDAPEGIVNGRTINGNYYQCNGWNFPYNIHVTFNNSDLTCWMQENVVTNIWVANDQNQPVEVTQYFDFDYDLDPLPCPHGYYGEQYDVQNNCYYGYDNFSVTYPIVGSYNNENEAWYLTIEMSHRPFICEAEQHIFVYAYDVYNNLCIYHFQYRRQIRRYYYDGPVYTLAADLNTPFPPQCTIWYG
jgi:RHS repeat-associated protein